MTENKSYKVEWLEAMRGNFFGDILLYALKIFNIYHNETSSHDGSGIVIVDPYDEPERYDQLNNH